MTCSSQVQVPLDHDGESAGVLDLQLIVEDEVRAIC